MIQNYDSQQKGGLDRAELQALLADLTSTDVTLASRRADCRCSACQNYGKLCCNVFAGVANGCGRCKCKQSQPMRYLSSLF